MNVNTSGVLFTAQAAGKQMLRFGNGGSIVLIGSICGTIALEVRGAQRFPSSVLFASLLHRASNLGQPHVSDIAYHSSKGAVLQMTRSLACELGAHRVRVNSISPGFIDTRSAFATFRTVSWIKRAHLLCVVRPGNSLTSFLEDPAQAERWTAANPLGRIGRPDELRGVLAWLASDASSFCTGSK